MNQYQETLKKIGYYFADISPQEKKDFLKRMGYKDDIDESLSSYTPKEFKKIIDKMVEEYTDDNNDINDNNIVQKAIPKIKSLSEKTRIPSSIDNDFMIRITDSSISVISRKRRFKRTRKLKRLDNKLKEDK